MNQEELEVSGTVSWKGKASQLQVLVLVADNYRQLVRRERSVSLGVDIGVEVIRAAVELRWRC